MKTSAAVLFAFLLSACSLFAQEKSGQQDAPRLPGQQKKKLEIPDRVLKPFLWKIEGDTPNYIFGTVHVADPRALKLHPAADRAFEQSEAAFFEIDFRKAEQQSQAMRLPAGEKLEDTLSADTIQRLDKRVNKVAPGLRDKEKLRPIAWVLVLPQLEAMKRFPSRPLDIQLYQRATRTDKVVGGLEDPSLQLRELFKLSKEEQSQFVKSSLQAMDDADAKNENQLMTTINYYLRGDAKAFHKYFMDDLKAGSMPKPLQKKLIQGLLISRNQRMAKQIKELTAAFPNRKHFFAVGTAHMLGENSVLTYLEKDGIKTSAVTE